MATNEVTDRKVRAAARMRSILCCSLGATSAPNRSRMRFRPTNMDKGICLRFFHVIISNRGGQSKRNERSVVSQFTYSVDQSRQLSPMEGCSADVSKLPLIRPPASATFSPLREGKL